jgi:hypothetical protein
VREKAAAENGFERRNKSSRRPGRFHDGNHWRSLFVKSGGMAEEREL